VRQALLPEQGLAMAAAQPPDLVLLDKPVDMPHLLALVDQGLR
jgi:hypothetical protein